MSVLSCVACSDVVDELELVSRDSKPSSSALYLHVKTSVLLLVLNKEYFQDSTEDTATKLYNKVFLNKRGPSV